MAIAIGQQLGCYEVNALLGKGGMGEVYRARDTKLKRDVAIKILPDEFSRDASRVSRFQREAEVLASLNHPNIGAIYDLEEAGETRFLVLELVEGETLADRLRRGPIPVEEALKLAHSICEALEAAHERGVVHRDLKPANVKITLEGKVKVLDFGLAKVLEAAPAQVTSNSPTLLSAVATNGGFILGTAGYMSPEQAKGQTADARSDIFSFGCALYEMLTGRQAFHAESVTETLAAVLMREPDLQALPAGFNPKLEDVIRRCLAKDSRQRWHSIADVRLQLDAVIAEPRASSAASSTRPLWRRAFPIAAAALITFIITAVFFYNLRPSQPLNVVRFPFVLAEGQGFRFANRHMLAISPDGTNLVFAADRQLYLRKMNDPDARPVQGTADQRPTTPVFSPDGHWVAFYSFSDQRIKKIAVTGGPAVTICEADNPLGAVWATNDQLFIGQGKNILRVSGKGGKPETVVALKPNEIAQSPQLLPGDDALLFTLAQTGEGIDRWDKAQIVVQSLRTGERKVVLEGGSDARYVPTGHLIYAVGTTLLAVPFDSKTDRVTGAPAPVPVVEKVMRTLNRGTGAAQFSVSNNGTLAFVPGDAAVASGVLALVDRAGARKTIDVPPDGYVHLRISPNGKQLVMSADNSGGERIVYVYDLNNNAPRRRLTFEGRNTTAIWRDSQRVVFRSDRQTGIGLYQQTADGVRPAELLLKFNPGDSPSPEFFSLDGKTLVFSNAPAGPNTARSLYSLQLDKSEEPKLLVEHASNASLSPDGKWFAYSSTGGRSEVYVQAFPPTSAKYLVSTDGGDNPVWSPDGSELFYLSIASREIRSVQVQTQPTFLPRQTSRLPISLILISGPRAYDVTPDGKYFVATFPRSSGNGTDKAPLEQINITLNWFEELKQLVPVK